MPLDDAIVVLDSTVTDKGDASAIVSSNIDFVNLLYDEYLKDEEIAVDALRSYYVDYYLAQVNNGGFSQFVYNSRCSPRLVELIRDGMKAMGAAKNLAAFDSAIKLFESFGAARLSAYYASEYFGENADRDALNAPNDRIHEACEAEDLTALNADWLRRHPRLTPLKTVEQMKAEASRRGKSLPDRASRIADARESEPRYMKLIRALCDRAGHTLDRVTGGDSAGAKGIAWHFITDQGHHHMIDHAGKATMFKGHSRTDRVCEIDAPAD